jgi:DNA-binding transcriptional LysR family regulator
MNDRLDQLALFVRTAETGSFSKTAREFGLAQPSVSRAIASLEARLGVTLLRRTTRRVATTEAGEALAMRAREALAAIDDAESAARGADRLSGVLRVALPTAYGVRQVVPRLPGFLAAHPGLRLDLMMSDRYEDLVAEGADLALRLGNQPNSAFVTRRLASAPRVVVASPDYLRRRGAPAAVADLANHECLGGPADADREAWTFQREGKSETISVEVRIRTGSGSGVVACAVAGLGVATASLWMCGEELRVGRRVRILADYAQEPIHPKVVFPSGRRRSRKARAFSDYLSAAFDVDADGAAGLAIPPPSADRRPRAPAGR